MELRSLETLRQTVEETGKPFWELVLETDMDNRMVEREVSWEKMRTTWRAMVEASETYTGDRRSRSGLVGGDGLRMRQYAAGGAPIGGPFLAEVIAEALAMGESNACMRRIVAAPTAGSCGTMPAVLLPLWRRENIPEDRMLEALRTNFEQDEEMRQYLLACDKFGNNIRKVDEEAAQIVERTAAIVASQKNYLGNPFRPDFSSPSTHLMYGYWVGATPDGRKAREMLNYGVDPLFGDASGGLGMRMLSNRYLPFETMSGGCASHFGINPGYFKGKTLEEKGLEFRDKIFRPLFFNEYDEGRVSPFYLYVNVTTPEMLRKVLKDPKKYAPSGVYIVRIHGTFVNFLDLSPEIQEDIIKRLDPASTAMSA